MSQKLLQSAGTFGSLTLVSRIFGFVRDMVLAQVFGATAGMDAFLIAQKIPNLFRRLFAEGAFSQAFVPILSEYKTQRSPDCVRIFISRVAGNLSLILFICTFLGMLGAPLIISLFAPGFGFATAQVGRFTLAYEMLRITFPYLFFISLTAFMGGILNTYGIFSVSAFCPVLLNISLIVAALYCTKWFSVPIYALAWAICFAGLIQLLFHLPFVFRKKLLKFPVMNFQDPGVRRILKLMVPALLGVSVNQINLLLDTLFASFLQVGSITWLYYADRLMEFPLGIFGVGLGTVILPNLASAYSAKEQAAFSKTLRWAIQGILLISLPACLGLYVLSGPLVCTLFQNGRFTPEDVAMCQIALMAYSPAVVGLMCVKVLASGFYARQEIKTPVKIAIKCMLANAVLNLVFILPFGHAGLAFATACCAMLNAGLLLHQSIKSGFFEIDKSMQWFIARVFFSAMAMSVLLYVLLPEMSHWIGYALWKRVACLLGFVGLGMVVYGLTLFVGGVRVSHLVHAK